MIFSFQKGTGKNKIKKKIIINKISDQRKKMLEKGQKVKVKARI